MCKRYKHYTRDLDELRMDAQDMMEEMERLEDWMNGYSQCLCQHGVSQYHYCEKCEKEWEISQERGE